MPDSRFRIGAAIPRDKEVSELPIPEFGEFTNCVKIFVEENLPRVNSTCQAFHTRDSCFSIDLLKSYDAIFGFTLSSKIAKVIVIIDD